MEQQRLFYDLTFTPMWNNNGTLCLCPNPSISVDRILRNIGQTLTLFAFYNSRRTSSIRPDTRETATPANAMLFILLGYRLQFLGETTNAMKSLCLSFFYCSSSLDSLWNILHAFTGFRQTYDIRCPLLFASVAKFVRNFSSDDKKIFIMILWQQRIRNKLYDIQGTSTHIFIRWWNWVCSHLIHLFISLHRFLRCANMK